MIGEYRGEEWLSNHSPASLISVLCKVLGHILRERKRCGTQHVSPPCPQGRLSDQPCIFLWHSKSNVVDLIGPDLNKAFDYVHQGKVLIKLEKIGIITSITWWLRSLLKGELQLMNHRMIMSCHYDAALKN